MHRSAAQVERQRFPTPLPVTGTIATPFGTPISGPTPVPALGSGQYYEDDEIDKSEINVLYGDARFGYGQFIDNENLYIMWVTDKDGRHYLIVDENNEILFGKFDEQTEERREDESFKQFLIDREALLNENIDIEADIESKEKMRDGLIFASYLFVGGSLGICIFASAGACTIATPIGATAGVTAIGTAINEAVDVDRELVRLNDMANKLSENEDKLLGRFAIALISD